LKLGRGLNPGIEFIRITKPRKKNEDLPV